MMNGEIHKPDVKTDDPPTMHDVDDPMTIVVVYFVVLGLAGVNIGLSVLGLGRLALPVQLGIGIVQAGVVAYYWMHLRRRDTVVILTALSALFFLFIMFVLTLSDYLTRQYIAI
ncbi:MAG TPA: cytochrome C oxidase subunit IV family protein [Gemmataceae bacterium]|nr:cytochrome C oxidase subunit IV family protein [Gemmataceae bacterium]